MGSFRKGFNIARMIILFQVIGILAFALWPHVDASSYAGSKRSIQDGDISAGQEVSANLGIGQKHSYGVTVSSGHFSRLVIQPGDFAVSFAIYDPNGKLSRDGRSRPYGPTPISWKAQITGKYLVEISCFDGPKQGGKYAIRLEESRDAEPNDETRIVSEIAVSEAESLSAKQVSESNRLA